MSPQNEAQRSLKSQALATGLELAQLQWRPFRQAGTSISTVFLVSVIFWLAVLFFSFGLFAPANSTGVVALAVAALSVSAALFLSWKNVGLLGELKLGQYQAPMSLDGVASSRDVTFMELAAPIKALAPGVDDSVQATRPFLHERMTCTAGLFSQGVGRDYGDASENYPRVISRVTGLPIYESNPGETRPYDRQTGCFTRVILRGNFDWGKGGWGAWELAMRYSFVNLDSADVHGRLSMVVAGVNWYLHPHVKWRLDYGLGHVAGRQPGGNLDIFQTRVEVDFSTACRVPPRQSARSARSPV